MKVVVASQNPVKVESIKRAFEKAFPSEKFEFTGVSVPSNVAAQPMTNEETLKGARNRLNNIKKEIPMSDFWVSIEGGLEIEDEKMVVFAWVIIANRDFESKSRTADFILPQKTMELINQGYELGHADDIVFGKVNSKQEMGSVGILTKGIIDRTEYYEHAAILALIPFINEELYIEDRDSELYL
jgi:inosine/xanthosine triphosphatase